MQVSHGDGRLNPVRLLVQVAANELGARQAGTTSLVIEQFKVVRGKVSNEYVGHVTSVISHDITEVAHHRGCSYCGVSSVQRSFQAAAGESADQPSGWALASVASDRPRSSRWVCQPAP